MIDFAAVFAPEKAVAAARPIDLPLLPIEVATALQHADHFAFLDTSDGEATGRGFSVLACNPQLVFRSKNETCRLRIKNSWQTVRGNPFNVLASLFGACHITPEHHTELPFCGGAIGYFGYDLFPFVERYERLSTVDDLDLPDCYLAFYDTALLYDHQQRQWHIAGANVFSHSPNIDELLQQKARQLFSLVESRRPRSGQQATASAKGGQPASNFSKPYYLKAVEKAIEHIYAGDIYQVNLSQRFHQRARSAPFEIFRALRQINPSQYGAYLPYNGHSVISSSPELFLRTNGRRVETRPIKGTRPRGQTPAEDDCLRAELANSAKDRAELSMIVDLERNDLGRVCEYGSVRVEEHANIEPLPTVFHTVSTVVGELRPEVGPIGLLRATFPGGSITGCPKIRSIEIIDDLEPTRRNVYTGSIGCIDFSGDMILNIVIRTLITKSRDVYFQVGGGIVADSDPEAEYEETLDKAAAMIRALQQVEQADE